MLNNQQKEIVSLGDFALEKDFEKYIGINRLPIDCVCVSIFYMYKILLIAVGFDILTM